MFALFSSDTGRIAQVAQGQTQSNMLTKTLADLYRRELTQHIVPRAAQGCAVDLVQPRQLGLVLCEVDRAQCIQ
jgi:hypothetical protein